MRICIISQSLYSLGGVQRVIVTLLNKMLENPEYEITVMMPYLSNESNIFGLDSNVKIVNTLHFEKKSISTFILKGLRRINKKTCKFDELHFYFLQKHFILLPGELEGYINILNNGFDVIIGAGCWQSLIVQVLSEKINANCFGWMHSTYESYFSTKSSQGKGYENFFRDNIKGLKELIVLTKSDKDIFDKKIKTNSKVLYNPIAERFLMKKIEIPNNDELLFVGRLAMDCKGLDFLVDIVKKIYIKRPTIHLTIVGEGKDKVALEKKVLDAKLDSVISLVGRKNDVENYYRKSKVLLVPSRWEGFGLVLIEAMGCGVPVVAFHNKGPDEILINEQGGFLINQYDTEEFSNRVLDLLDNKSVWTKKSQEAKDRANDFLVDKILREFKKIVFN